MKVNDLYSPTETFNNQGDEDENLEKTISKQFVLKKQPKKQDF